MDTNKGKEQKYQKDEEQKIPEIIETNQVEILYDESNGSKVINQYNILQKIGEGAYAKVKLVYNIDDEKYYAIKKFNKTILQKKSRMVRDDNGTTQYKNQWNNVEKEIEIMKMLNHQNIVKLYEIINYDEKGKVYLVIEYAQQGEILYWDEKKQVFNYKNQEIIKSPDFLKILQKVMLGCCKGLQYLHNLNIIHRDIKPQNILVDDQWNAKICDFDTSYRLHDDKEKLKGTEGTFHFMAPESLRDTKDKSGYCGKMADLFSLGVTFYCMLYLKLPFNHHNILELFNQIQKKEVELTGAWPDNLIDLIKQLLIKNPQERITLEKIFSHPWFTTDIK